MKINPAAHTLWSGKIGAERLGTPVGSISSDWGMPVGDCVGEQEGSNFYMGSLAAVTPHEIEGESKQHS